MDALNGRLPWRLQRSPASGDWTTSKVKPSMPVMVRCGWYRSLHFIGARLTSEKSHYWPIAYGAPLFADTPSNHHLLDVCRWLIVPSAQSSHKRLFQSFDESRIFRTSRLLSDAFAPCAVHAAKSRACRQAAALSTCCQPRLRSCFPLLSTLAALKLKAPQPLV